MAVVPMSAGKLWEELDELRRTRDDFADLEVYVQIIDRKSYDTEAALEAADDTETEMDETMIAEGEVFGVVVPTDYTFPLGAEQGVPGATYLVIRAVEWPGDEGEEEQPGARATPEPGLISQAYS